MRILDGVVDVILAVVPSAGMLFLFWRALKAMVEADRRERAAEARWHLEHPEIPDGTTRPAADSDSAAERPAAG